MRFFATILLFFCASITMAQVGLKKVCELPPDVQETSGLLILEDHTFLTINDKGNLPIVYRFDTNGVILNQVKIHNAVNTDWESLSIINDSIILIGDIGNQLNSRTDLRFYLLDVDSVYQDSAWADTGWYSYEDQEDFPPKFEEQHFDCEASLYHNDTMYLYTKDRTVPFEGETHIYGVRPFRGPHTGYRLGEYSTDTDYNRGSITGADLSPNNETMALLSYDAIYLFDAKAGAPFTDQFIGGINFRDYGRREAIVFADESLIYFTQEAWEGVPASLWSIDVKEHLSISAVRKNNFLEIRGNQIFIDSPEKYKLELFDILGRSKMVQEVQGSQNILIKEKGVILLQVSNEDYQETYKIYIP